MNSDRAIKRGFREEVAFKGLTNEEELARLRQERVYHQKEEQEQLQSVKDRSPHVAEAQGREGERVPCSSCLDDRVSGWHTNISVIAHSPSRGVHVFEPFSRVL